MSRRRRPTGDEIEEERRVAYVGLTRARDSLLVTADARRQSPFLRESSLNPEYGVRMRDDLVSELRGLRRRYRRASRRTGTAPREAVPALLRSKIDTLEEELLCRSMLNAPAP